MAEDRADVHWFFIVFVGSVLARCVVMRDVVRNKTGGKGTLSHCIPQNFVPKGAVHRLLGPLWIWLVQKLKGHSSETRCALR